MCAGVRQGQRQGEQRTDGRQEEEAKGSGRERRWAKTRTGDEVKPRLLKQKSITKYEKSWTAGQVERGNTLSYRVFSARNEKLVGT